MPLMTSPERFTKIENLMEAMAEPGPRHDVYIREPHARQRRVRHQIESLTSDIGLTFRVS